MNNTISTTALKVILVIVGIYGIFLAIDFGMGGFATLGLQGSTDFVQIIDTQRYGIQDNHFRFLGGILAAIGLFMIFAVTNLPKYQQTLKFIFALLVVGGIMRFTAGDLSILLSVEILAALAAEIALSAGLYLWLAREVQPSPTP